MFPEKNRSLVIYIISAVLILIWLTYIYVLDFSAAAGPLPSAQLMLYDYYVPFLLGVAFFLLILPLLRRINGAGSYNEPSYRTFLRYSFGALWIIDGILQMQPGMMTGFSNAILVPMTSSSPGFVASIVSTGISIWNVNPVAFNILASLLQVFIGICLIFFRDGSIFRATQVIAIFWGLVLWIFGEAFGGIFVSLGTWLTGSPGSAAIYMAVSVLLLTRSQDISDSRAISAFMSIFWAFAGLAQIMPANNFWSPGVISSIPSAMSQNLQPVILSNLLYGFSTAISATPVLVNGILVFAMLAAALMWYLIPRAASVYTVILSGITWVVFQGMGVFGGYGTDPNSGLPIVFVAAAYLILTWRKSGKIVGTKPVARATKAGMA